MPADRTARRLTAMRDALADLEARHSAQGRAASAYDRDTADWLRAHRERVERHLDRLAAGPRDPFTLDLFATEET